MKKIYLISCCLLVSLGFLICDATAASYSVTQISKKAIRNDAPVINDLGQVAWQGSYQGRSDIYLYEDGTIERISPVPFGNSRPQINNNGYVAWSAVGFEADDEPTNFGQLFLYDGLTSSQITQYSQNSFFSTSINDNNYVAFSRSYNSGLDLGVSLFNGEEIVQIVNSGRLIGINNKNHVFFEDSYTTINLYDGNSVIQIWSGILPHNIKINDNDQAVWISSKDIYFFDGFNVINLTNGAASSLEHTNMNSHGDIIWTEREGSSQYSLKYYDGNTIHNLAENFGYIRSGVINDCGVVAFDGISPTQSEGFANVFVYEGGKLTQLTNNNTFSDIIEGYPNQMNSRGDLVWRRPVLNGNERVYSAKNLGFGPAYPKLYEFKGIGSNEWISLASGSIGDINNDGFDDIYLSGSVVDAVVSADTTSKVQLISGKTGCTIQKYYGNQTADSTFWKVSGAGDVNGDGYDDFILQIPDFDATDTGLNTTEVHSGINYSILYSFTKNSSWIDAVAVGDVNNDGYDDLALNQGTSEVISGLNGNTLITFPQSVSFAGDVNNDDHFDLNVAGVIYSGQDGVTVLQNLTITGEEAGDINKDGLMDYVSSDIDGGHVFSGVDGSVIYDFVPDLGDFPYEGGEAAGDVNGDGYNDVVFLQKVNNVLTAAVLFSGENGELLYKAEEDFSNDNSGITVSAAGDVNNDGLDDIIFSGIDRSVVHGYPYGFASAISGVVEDVDGPVGGVVVSLKGRRLVDGKTIKIAAVTNDDGEFHLWNAEVPESTYRISAKGQRRSKRYKFPKEILTDIDQPVVINGVARDDGPPAITGNFIISGFVYNDAENREGIDDVFVELRRRDGIRLKLYGRTDSQGFYVFDNIPAGEYQMKVKKRGFSFGSRVTVEVSGNSSINFEAL